MKASKLTGLALIEVPCRATPVYGLSTTDCINKVVLYRWKSNPASNV
jgi:hypothetical protein